jgi:dihydrodipicolinate synthase/N-acetylneuraminate lyase
MGRLTSARLRGIWAGITMSWDSRDRFDEASYARNTESMCDAGVHGVYTSGSTGEFYALDDDEFRAMVDIQADICGRRRMPLQIGCNADSTRRVLRLLEYAAGKKEVGAAQVVVPYWMEMTDAEMLRYFSDLRSACPDLPLVHYNIPRAKRFLGGADYLRVLEVAPNLIGVKFTFAGSHLGDLVEALAVTPQLAYFVAEPYLATAMQLGAAGCYSSLVSTDPAFMLALYEHAAVRRWDEAIAMQKTAQQFYSDAVAFIQGLGEGLIDPVFDKGLAKAAGGLAGSQRTRPPYIGWSDATVRRMRRWLQDRYPCFLHPSVRKQARP